MRIWWCEVHQATNQMAVPAFCDVYALLELTGGDADNPCRMVEAELTILTSPATYDKEGEHCDNCGRQYSDVYTLPDDVWASIHDRAPAGLLCPTCALGRLLTEREGASAASYDIEIPDFVNRHGTW